MSINDLSLKSQFYISIMSVVTLVLLASFSYNIYSSYTYKVSSFIHESELQADLIADNAVAPIIFYDSEGLNNVLAQLQSYEDILQVLIYTKDGTLFSSYTNKKVDLDLKSEIRQKNLHNNMCFIKGMEDTEPFNSTSFIIKYDIVLDSESYGTLYIQKDTSHFQNFLKESMLSALVFSSILFLLILLFIYKI